MMCYLLFLSTKMPLPATGVYKCEAWKKEKDQQFWLVMKIEEVKKLVGPSVFCLSAFF